LLETKFNTLDNVTKNINKRIMYPDSFTFCFREMINKNDYIVQSNGKNSVETLEKVKDNLIQKLQDVIDKFTKHEDGREQEIQQ